MFSERGSASSRLTSIEVLHSTAMRTGDRGRGRKRQQTGLIMCMNKTNCNKCIQLEIRIIHMDTTLYVQPYRSRWGGSSSRAGCCRWFPADTWNSLVAQNKDPWRRKKKKSLLFSCDCKEPQVHPPTNQLLTPHIFHRISFWGVFRFGGFKWEHASTVWTPTKNQTHTKCADKSIRATHSDFKMLPSIYYLKWVCDIPMHKYCINYFSG